MQFRSEFYNLFNHHNNYILASTLDIEPGTSQQIQAERGSPSASCASRIIPDDRRNIQFALKLLFQPADGPSESSPGDVFSNPPPAFQR